MNVAPFTEDELRILRSALLAQSVPQNSLLRKLNEAIEPRARGPQVFHLELAIGHGTKAAGRRASSEPWAPTMNEYNGLAGWQKKKLRAAVDQAILQRMAQWPRWNCGVRFEGRIVGGKPRRSRVGGMRRIVEVTRYSSRRPDELSVDVIGGKIPIDRLVQAGVLRDDTDDWLVRKADWQQAPADHGRLVVRVYELPS